MLVARRCQKHTSSCVGNIITVVVVAVVAGTQAELDQQSGRHVLPGRVKPWAGSGGAGAGQIAGLAPICGKADDPGKAVEPKAVDKALDEKRKKAEAKKQQKQAEKDLLVCQSRPKPEVVVEFAPNPNETQEPKKYKVV